MTNQAAIEQMHKNIEHVAEKESNRDKLIRYTEIKEFKGEVAELAEKMVLNHINHSGMILWEAKRYYEIAGDIIRAKYNYLQRIIPPGCEVSNA